MIKTDCGEIVWLLPVYISGQLKAETRISVVTHLAVCENCRAEAAQAIKLAKACETMFPDPDKNFMHSALKLLDSDDETEKPKTARELLTEAADTVHNTLTLAQKTLALIKL
jgi:Predicted transmembrane transcriptional regulator (anti-sigma factor)